MMRLPLSPSQRDGIGLAGGVVLALLACHAGSMRPHLPITVPVGHAFAVETVRDDTSTAPTAPLIVDVHLDAMQTSPADPKALQNVLEHTVLRQAEADPAATPVVPDWLLWGHLDGARLAGALSYPGAQPSDPPGLYAAGGPEIKTVCLANTTPQKLQVRLLTRLPRGIYTIERLTVTPAADIPGNVQPTSDVLLAQDMPNAAFQLERLQGEDLKRAGLVVKTGQIEPGQIVFIRYTEQSRSIEGALTATYRALAQLEKSRPGPAHRLRRMLREGDPYRSGVRTGGLSERLKSIQHLLLVVRQAQSLHHNYQSRGNVNAEAGAVLMGSLEQLMDGLSEASATLLGLVPQVSVAPTDQAGAAHGRRRVLAAVAADSDTRAVSIALSNAGGHSVENVKLGLDSSALPADVVCDPADPAFFGTLRPGQTVHAMFRLRCPAGTTINRRLCVADVCFHAGGGPAHLRPRPW